MIGTTKQRKTFGTLQTERRCRKFMDEGGFEKLASLNRIRQEAEISDMMETNLREAGIMLTGGYDKPFIDNIK